MNAATIAAALGEARREGRAWRCRCALCGGRNLTLKDGAGALLVTCWNGCDRIDVLAELRRHGLLNGRADYKSHVVSTPRRADDVSRTARALNIWRAAEPGGSTIVTRYLASRGIVLDRWPASLRFHPHCPRPRDDAGNLLPPLPAMVALIEHVERGPLGLHCTYLRPDGAGKADTEKSKAMFGAAVGGAVRFGLLRAGQTLLLAEGIETALSVHVACALPAWAALSASGIAKLILPPEATHVVICADNDARGTGERAAHDAAARWLAERRHVRVAIPPEPGADFNDVLNGGSAEISEARHVA